MNGLSGWVGQLFHSFNLCVCVRVSVFVGGARECHRHTVSYHRNYKNWNPVLFYSFPFKNQYRSVKKTKYSLHFLQLLALPYGAVIIMKEDLVEGWGRGALSYWDKQFFGIQTRAFYNIHILRELFILANTTTRRFWTKYKNVKKKSVLSWTYDMHFGW